MSNPVQFSPLITRLIADLQCLPGVGPKSAQRMVFHLLERDRQRANQLAEGLLETMAKVGRCRSCRTFCEHTQCDICLTPSREGTQLCVVSSPAEVMSVEQTGAFKGLYFVLMGQLSPIDGIGPKDIGVPEFTQKLATGHIKEIILATNPTVEGEATAYYLAQIAKEHGVVISRIAHGVPLGGELEHIDGGTLAKALLDRVTL